MFTIEFIVFYADQIIKRLPGRVNRFMSKTFNAANTVILKFIVIMGVPRERL